MDRPTCETCPYWREVEGQQEGECRRHTPTIGERIDGIESMVNAEWPYTDYFDWCGEHPDFPACMASRTVIPPPAPPPSPLDPRASHR
jgi:hypothetical protein